MTDNKPRTFREALQKEHPEGISKLAAGRIIACPCFYGYEKQDDCPCVKQPGFSCEACWDRFIPAPKFQRISKTEYYLEIARAVSKRSTCLRRQYGAVIVKDDCIISTGYNGAARGEPNCCDVGECWREAHNIPHGEQYEKCVAVHAEDNAISQAGRETIGADLYLVGFEDGAEIDARPCMMCSRKIKNARIKRVITKEGVIYENGN